MAKIFSIPNRPLARVRLAFLGLGGITLGLGGVSLLTVAQGAPVGPNWGLVGLGLVALGWLWTYRSGWVHWWKDPLVAVGLTLYSLSFPNAAFALGAFYVHLYFSALYGTRWTMLWTAVLTVGAYVAAVAVLADSVQAGLGSPLLVFQIPGLLLTGAVMRLLYEALRGQERLALRVEEASRMEAVGRLTGGIAHDFNNMLTAIMGSLELAILDLDEEDEIRKDLALAQETAKRAGALTQQLLTFSKRKVMRPKELEVNQTLSDLHGMLSRMAGAEARLNLDLDPEETFIHIDPTSFEQIVMNLVVNARDATDENGVRIVIRTGTVSLDGHGEARIQSGSLDPASMDAGSESRSSLPEGRYAVLEVADDGRGMDSATASKVFEPFFTTKKQGTGLGLSTVYGVVTGARGHIAIRSRPGKGTVVRIFLPVAPRSDKTQPADAPIHSEAATTPSSPRPPRILVVDDEPGVREVMRRVLVKAGFEIVSASDGEEALATFEEQQGRFDLVITDLSLPGMSGSDLGRALRVHQTGLPLLLTSGYSEDSTEVARARMPGEEFLEKPFGSKELIDAATTLTGRGDPNANRVSRNP